MFSNHSLHENIQESDEPIGVYPSGGATHCRNSGTLKNIGEVYLHKNRLVNILSYAKVRDKHNITYNDVQEVFTVHTPHKWIYFRRSKIPITANLTARSVMSHLCTLFKKINKASQINKYGMHKGQDPHTTCWYSHQHQTSIEWYVATC